MQKSYALSGQRERRETRARSEEAPRLFRERKFEECERGRSDEGRRPNRTGQ
jgi:hypothetical protein